MTAQPRAHFVTLISLSAVLLWSAPARAYVEIPYTLGRLITESTHVMLVRVEKVDKEKNLIIYRKVKDIKGTHPDRRHPPQHRPGRVRTRANGRRS